MGITRHTSAAAKIPMGESDEPLRIDLRGRREWLLIVWLALVTAAWGIGGGMASYSFDDALALWANVAFLVVWALVLLFECGLLAWYLVGREEIEVGNDGLVLRRITGPYCHRDSFEREKISGIRITPYPGALVRLYRVSYGWGKDLAINGPSSGSVLFDYGRRSYRFGQKLDQAEATHLATTVADQLGLPIESED